MPDIHSNKLLGLYVGGTHVLVVKTDVYINKYNKFFQVL